MKTKRIDENSLLTNIPFLQLTILYWILISLDFFATPNPYSAIHSGYAGAASGIISTNLAISPLYLILVAFAITILLNKRVILTAPHFILIGCMFISGILSNTFIANAVTYIYNSIAIMSMCTIAYLMAENNSLELSQELLLKCMNIVTVLMILGIGLALMRPNVYGVVSLAFSRTSRGEITYWLVLGFQILYPSLSLVILEKYKKNIYLIGAVFVWFIIFASSKRNYTVVSFLPFILYFLIRKKDIKKLFFILISSIILLFLSNKIYLFITMGHSIRTQNGLSAILNGRLELWTYYWEKFINKPIFGNGAFFMDRYNDYNTFATSEVGLLKWFGEYGMIFGGIMICFVIKACIKSIQILKNRNLANLFDLWCAYMFLSLICLIPQSFSRMLEYLDLLFWFSLFYLNFRNHLNRHVLIIRWGD